MPNTAYRHSSAWPPRRRSVTPPESTPLVVAKSYKYRFPPHSPYALPLFNFARSKASFGGNVVLPEKTDNPPFSFFEYPGKKKKPARPYVRSTLPSSSDWPPHPTVVWGSPRSASMGGTPASASAGTSPRRIFGEEPCRSVFAGGGGLLTPWGGRLSRRLAAKTRMIIDSHSSRFARSFTNSSVTPVPAPPFSIFCFWPLLAGDSERAFCRTESWDCRVLTNAWDSASWVWSSPRIFRSADNSFRRSAICDWKLVDDFLLFPTSLRALEVASKIAESSASGLALPINSATSMSSALGSIRMYLRARTKTKRGPGGNAPCIENGAQRRRDRRA